MAGGTIRVLLAEDVAILRKGLKALLAAYPDVEIAGEAPDGLEAVRMALELAPQVVLMDLSMPGFDGVDATRAIKSRNPAIAVLALTGHAEEELVLAARAAGADGYLLKSATADELALAIRRASRGLAYFCPEAAGFLSPSSAS